MHTASNTAILTAAAVRIDVDQLRAYSIDLFCQLHGISRGTFFNMRKAGTGPKESRAGRRVLITKANAAEWLARS
jgi:predicted DNA-binding transcriptional regulator AlpA